MFSKLSLRFNFLRNVAFDNIAYADFVKAFDSATTFIAVVDFLHVVLESLELFLLSPKTNT